MTNLNLSIKRTQINELETLLNIQKEAFAADLKLYEDYQTSPVNESLVKLTENIKNFIHYTIRIENEIIGGIDIRKKNESEYRLSKLFLSDKFQNKGLGSRVMEKMEEEFSSKVEWSLYTPYLNKRNHHFYEKLGYKKIGEYPVTEKLTLFKYVKKCREN
ncbi:GNAT family N-acetyltransferase [Mesobacillus zeae]|uniref:N-acetyltransferase n=1 Tax=Mesobacillus zeae TaxID=1917180 RepID=A0A398AYE9_9BACI|nr:GNAT family N-acetyltransferase [Mesobacillus zeae]RID82605.1 N-acetyltransferase [Mesobacillus zeae]